MTWADQDMLAIPTVKGEKSPSERFAGALTTYTIEALMQNGSLCVNVCIICLHISTILRHLCGYYNP